MKYTGPLAKPITRPRVGVFSTEEQIGAECRRVTDAQFAKLPLLAEAHGVAPGDWFTLVLRLAETHVTGFKLVEAAGRKQEWSELDKAELRIAVDDVRSSTNKTLDASIREAVKSDRWREKTKSMKPATLRQHYYAAHPGFVRIVHDARAFDALPPDVKRALNDGKVEEARQLLER